MGETIENFGGNVRFDAREVLRPRTIGEVLAVLRDQPVRRTRVMGARHSWSPLIRSEDRVVDMGAFRDVAIEEDAAGAVAVVGGGCTLKRLVEQLRALGDRWALPSMGAITQQTISGAISTGTHGSGRPCMSHFIEQVELATCGRDGKPRVLSIDGGDLLRAAQVGLGCLGIIVSVRLRLAPRFDVLERMETAADLSEVLAGEEEFDLQQFMLLPYSWRYAVWRRRVATSRESRELLRAPGALLHRATDLFLVDVGYHQALTSVIHDPARTIEFFENDMVALLARGDIYVDRYDEVLTLEHELFQHEETEYFVRPEHLAPALELLRWTIEVFAGRQPGAPPEGAPPALVSGARDHERTYAHHYPLLVRRIMRDDTMLSMASGVPSHVYSISLFTYLPPDERQSYQVMADLLVDALIERFDARLHWGKHFPEAAARHLPRLYPQLARFRQLVRDLDPESRFQNQHTSLLLGP